ncbi:putative disease resistance RPP13-like protein 3 [Abeliophyllum distichum]|uniref:Disease resistance RPP13-like protein 3 n=1 Tax=Abeliophyllum distichum TaxID=126358 RepID=A0ABD1V1F6_9LAMI
MSSSKHSIKNFWNIEWELDRVKNSICKMQSSHLKDNIISFIEKLSSKIENVIDLSMDPLERSSQVYHLIRQNLDYPEGFYTSVGSEFMDLVERYLLLVREFSLLLSIPKLQSATPNIINEHVLVFIDFLFEVLATFKVRFNLKGQTQFLEMELKLLTVYLWDAPLQAFELEETKSILTDTEALVNEVGSYFHTKFLTRKSFMVSENDPFLSLSDLLKKFEIFKTKIEKHCITVLKIQTNMPKKTVVVSLVIVDSLLDDLKDLMNNNANTIVEIKDQFKTIYVELLLLRSCIKDIDLQQHPEFQQHVIQIRDIAYEVEYIVYNSLPHVWYLTLRLSNLIEKIEHIWMALEETMQSYDTGVHQVAEYPIERASLQAAKPPILEDTVVGFKDEATKIISQLIGEPKDLQILSVYGMPGLGKTTLAKKLYNDPTINDDCFDLYAWCVVSQTYQRRNMLIDILRTVGNLSKERMPNMEEGELGEALYKSLKGRSYFIVMDDIWNIDAWDGLKRYFPDDKCGSRILFTTRLKDVGLQASPKCVVNELPFLSEAESWDLLERKVFQKEHCPPQLIDIGKQIATNCHGLPLAIVVMAAVLANMEKKESLWKEVVGSLSSHISDGNNKCMDILELSYKHLPVHLKPCFLYFGVFPEDTEILVSKLIALWISEGLIEKQEKKSVDDVAQEYLMDLIGRSLILTAKRKSDGRVKACNMHDLLRDMCLKIADQENFVKVIQDDLSICVKHHVSIHSYSNGSCSRPSGLHVRPLLRQSLDPSTFISSGLELLRVFDNSIINMEYNDQIRIQLFVHLRYLAVSYIPSSTASLQNLEFLLVDNKEVAQIPQNLLNKMKLRYLHFRGGAQFTETFRMRASKDESLQMNNLESISFLFIYEENDEKILRYSPHLRRLKCAFKVIWDSSKRKYRYPNLDFLNKLESLRLSFHDKFETKTSLGLMSFPSNIKKLNLCKFDLSWEQINIIGGLLNLEILKLQNVFLEGKRWDTREGEFLELKFLELDGVQISEWKASSEHFPKLERLVLRKCYHLKNIPSSFGEILTLEMIEVHGCRNCVTECAMKIEEKQRESGNEEFKVIISRSTILR